MANRGVYTRVQDAPDGMEGDYIVVGGTRFWWNTHDLEWTDVEPIDGSVRIVGGGDRLGEHDVSDLLKMAHPDAENGDSATVSGKEWKYNAALDRWESVGSVLVESDVAYLPATEFLGEYPSIIALWDSYPRGGVSGDYVMIENVKYIWDSDSLEWVAYVPESGSRECYETDGDMRVTNNLSVGGVLRARVAISQYDSVIQELYTGMQDYKKQVASVVAALRTENQSLRAEVEAYKQSNDDAVAEIGDNLSVLRSELSRVKSVLENIQLTNIGGSVVTADEKLRWNEAADILEIDTDGIVKPKYGRGFKASTVASYE